MINRSRLLGIAAALALAGCAAAGPRDDTRIARDPVCLYNRDLGCVNVRVDDDTPRATYEGVTYYFCNEECRKTFEADPEKYIAVLR